MNTIDRTRESQIGFPAEATPLVGRADDVAAIRDAIVRDGARLVTLTGPAGIGKTRLAMAVATDLADMMADGTYLAPLAAGRDADVVPATIAQAFGITEAPDEPPAQTLTRYLGDKRALLLLDSFEQVIAAAPFVAALLDAPRLTILVTSRTALGIAGERDYPVLPLAVPNPDHPPPTD